ncbi:hypothetical protein [Actinobacillus equuli]|nr:hypothetical protein [Actinobacillus equuli]WGE45179.1 hypothetical protein NYR65_03815 [Actinobacillus equuli subsp. equuli]
MLQYSYGGYNTSTQEVKLEGGRKGITYNFDENSTIELVSNTESK